MLTRAVDTRLPTDFGEFLLRAYTDSGSQHLHLALVKGAVEGLDAPLVRIHSECLTGDVFSSLRCDCGIQLEVAMQAIGLEGSGVSFICGRRGEGSVCSTSSTPTTFRMVGSIPSRQTCTWGSGRISASTRPQSPSSRIWASTRCDCSPITRRRSVRSNTRRSAWSPECLWWCRRRTTTADISRSSGCVWGTSSRTSGSDDTGRDSSNPTRRPPAGAP